jgi:hypothetical protein
MRQPSKICTVTFNTTTTVLIDVKEFVEPLQVIEEIRLSGNLETGDKTTITVNDLDKTVLYGTFRWDQARLYNIKRLNITPAFLAGRIGILTIKYRAVTDKFLKSATVGVSAALPSPLQKM